MVRLDFQNVLPEAMKRILALERFSHNSGLERSLLELIKLRASQINECAYCIDMHSKDARTNGETEQRLYGLSAWRETPYYTDRERAALTFTEAVTLISENQIPDEVYESVRKEFNEEDLAKLTVAIIMINVWNRLTITFRSIPGSYQPDHFVAKAGVSAEMATVD